MRLLLPGMLLLASCSEPTLESRLNSIIARYDSATVAVSIRDGDLALDVQGDRPFHAASTMKVPVMIELFRRHESGLLSLDSTLQVKNAFRSIVDGSLYSIKDDSDQEIYQRIGERMTLRELMRRMMTVSSNLATNLLIEEVSADSVRQTASRLGAPSMNVLRGVEDLKAFERKLSNTTTSRDLAALLYKLTVGEAVSPAADSAMLEIMAMNVFNDMIPAGLPEDARVVNKTGWITAVHHDAAVVYPHRQRPYVLVILTEGLEDERQSSALGAEIARTVHAALRQ